MKVINSHRQAIKTKYLGPTNSKGSRIKATAYSGSITIPWDYSLNSDGNHDEAAKALCKKFDWDTECLISGGAHDETGNFYVCLDNHIYCDECGCTELLCGHNKRN